MADKGRSNQQSERNLKTVARRTREGRGSQDPAGKPSLKRHLRRQMTEARTNLQEGFGGFSDDAQDAGKRVKRRFNSGVRRWEEDGARSIKRPPIGTPPSGIPPSGRPPSGIPPSGVPPEIERKMKDSRQRQRDRE
jgi:hypothetical protein